jgi:hypothetical protein
MIRKSGYRFSEKIMRKEEATLGEARLLPSEARFGRTLPHDQMAAIRGTWQMPVWFYLHRG